MVLSDRQKMIVFIASQITDGQATLTLAGGLGGSVTTNIVVLGDDLAIVSNCPEYVTVREVYDHLRWKAMPTWEQWERLRAGVIAPSPVGRLERLTDRFESALAAFVRATPTPTGDSLTTCHADDVVTPQVKAQNADNNMHVLEAENVVVLGSRRYVLEPEYLAILSCLLAANGAWVSQDEMKESKRLLEPFVRLDRTIRKFKKDHRTIAKGIEAERGRGFRLKLT